MSRFSFYFPAHKINKANPDCSGFVGFDADVQSLGFIQSSWQLLLMPLLVLYLREFTQNIINGIYFLIGIYSQFQLLSFHEINVIVDLF